ncbi:MAG TPA: shikimate kinase [Nitrososphaerales archaeon]|nr:shikimate kinase [Nitrososphaerales archaeon]
MTTFKAKATSFGAISIVNAIASGRGATAGVKLSTEAEVEIEDSKGEWEVTVNGRRWSPGLAIETARRAIRSAGKDPDAFSGKVRTTSAIPVGVGLKTSSSSSTAIALAVHAALGQSTVDPRRVLDCSVEASLASGASVTGALDDAAGCLLGGINMTDNLERKILSSKPLDQSLKVVIMVPKTKSRRRTVSPEFIRKFGRLTDFFLEMSLKGEHWEAMLLNGMAYSSILKYDPFPALRAVELGALGAGLSGTGPSVAAVFDPSKRDEIDALTRDWASDGSGVLGTETNNEHGRVLAVG